MRAAGTHVQDHHQLRGDSVAVRVAGNLDQGGSVGAVAGQVRRPGGRRWGGGGGGVCCAAEKRCVGDAECHDPLEGLDAGADGVLHDALEALGKVELPAEPLGSH